MEEGSDDSEQEDGSGPQGWPVLRGSALSEFNLSGCCDCAPAFSHTHTCSLWIPQVPESMSMGGRGAGSSVSYSLVQGRDSQQHFQDPWGHPGCWPQVLMTKVKVAVGALTPA